MCAISPPRMGPIGVGSVAAGPFRCFVLRPLVLLLGLVLALVVLCCWTSPAARADTAQQQLEDYVADNLAQLDLGDFQRFAADYTQGADVKTILLQLIQGQLQLGPRQWLDALWQAATRSFRTVLPTLASIVMVALLFNLLFGLTQGFVNRQTNDIVYFVCYTAVLLLVVSMVVGAVNSVRHLTDNLVGLINAVSPPLLTLLSAVGGTTSSALLNPQLALFATLVANVVGKVVIPLFLVSVVFATVGNLSSNVRLDKLQSAVRYLIGCLLGVVFGLFTTYLSVAGIAGGMADTMSLRAARYVIGSYLPLVGGYVSQGFDLVTAGVMLIKNALGVFALLMVVSMVLAPLVQVLVLTVGLKLVAGLVEPIGDRRMASFIGGIAECMRSLSGAVAGVGFTFMVTMLLVMASCVTVL